MPSFTVNARYPACFTACFTVNEQSGIFSFLAFGAWHLSRSGGISHEFEFACAFTLNGFTAPPFSGGKFSNFRIFFNFGEIVACKFHILQATIAHIRRW